MKRTGVAVRPTSSASKYWKSARNFGSPLGLVEARQHVNRLQVEV
jgi:hypothetical protein